MLFGGKMLRNEEKVKELLKGKYESDKNEQSFTFHLMLFDLKSKRN
jgi:hypothetical protein